MITIDDIRAGLDNAYALGLLIVIACIGVACLVDYIGAALHLRFGRHEPVAPKPTYPVDDVQRALQHLRDQKKARR